MFTNPLNRSVRTHRSVRLRRLVATAVAVPLAVLGMVTVSAPAAQAAAVGPAAPATVGGFPSWYEDNNQNRVEPCLEATDANCVLPATEPNYNPALPVSFPTNFPSEFFYAYAASDTVATPGCGSSAPGRALVTLALEGAFIGGAPKAGDQMTFGRIRVRATSGLCAGQSYTFKHPFGQVTLTANAAGAIPVNTPGATVDVGCLAPSVLAPCDYSLANGSEVMGSPANGFLRWDGTAPAAPPGYLGDGATLHPIVGANGAGSINGLSVSGPDGNGGVFTGTTNLFTVAGRLAGATASPNPIDFGGSLVGQTTPAKTVTLTNLDKASITLGGNAIRPRGNVGFNVNSGTCRGITLARNASCTFTVTARAGAAGPVSDFIDVTYTGAGTFRSPLGIPATVTGTLAGNQPAVTVTPNPVAFGPVRIRTTSTIPVTVRNSGNAPLSVGSVLTSDATLGADTSQYRLLSNTCVGTSVAAGGTCTIQLVAAPKVRGPHPITLVVNSNISGGVTNVPVTMTATGGNAAVSTDKLPIDQFPTWYRDENDVKLSQCIDPKDPFCVVLPDATFNPGQPLVWLPDHAATPNFPGEFFYTVADSDLLTTPGCAGSAPGKSAYRSAIEGTFVNGEPIDGQQMVFGRERFFVTSGLCPGSVYTITTPYGQTRVQANARGGIARNAATVDIGCAPVVPALCNFEDALSSPVLGGVLRWDPAVAPAAPSGYIGDAVTLHKVVGAPFAEDGVNPSNYFKITGPGLPAAGLQTTQFSVMGKLRGPLEATAGVDATGTFVAPDTAVGSSSAGVTLTLTNTGLSPLTLSSMAVGGTDGADFAATTSTCVFGSVLAAGASCDVAVTFSPSATGLRTGTLTFRHTGLNDPFVVPLAGTGTIGGGTAAISFTPRSLSFPSLAVGRTGKIEQVTVSNAGGSADLNVSNVALGGVAAADYALLGETCTAAPVAAGGTCTVDVVFSPTAGGARNATIVLTDNAPGGTHSVPLSGTGFAGAKAVSASLGKHGYPTYYQDANGVRLEPCLDPQNCVLLGVPDPNVALSVPDNFPNEFFYALADSQQITIPGCNGAPDGTAQLRLGLEGSFATGAPVAGDQTTFTRVRLTVKGGLCPGAQGYQAVTPYGTFTFNADAAGNVTANAGTQDTGCGAAPCAFTDALASPGAVYLNVATPIEGFLRWDTNVTAAPPAGYLGDGTSFQPVVGGTYVKPGTNGTFNGFEVLDPAGNAMASSDTWLVVGKIAGPLAPSSFALDFGNVDQGSTSATKTVTVTNVGAAASAVTPSVTGQYAITGGTCGAGNSVAVDGTCTVVLVFRPTGTGTLTGTLTLTPDAGRTATVSLTGVGNPVAQPAITVAPGVLSYGTVTAGNTPSLSTTVTNSGTGPLNVTAVAVTGAQDYSRTGGTCAGNAFSLAGGASCTITVTFSPTAVGARTGSLTLTHNAAAGSTTVSLTGTGAASSWSVSPSPVGFGTVTRGTVKTSTLSVKNTGTVNGTIQVAGTTVVGTYFGVVVNPATSTCFNGTAVAPGKTCSISVTFSPAANAAVQGFTGTLSIDGGTASLPRLTPVTMTATTK